MLRIDLLHLVICVVPLVTALSDVSVANGKRLVNSITDLPVAEPTTSPLITTSNNFTFVHPTVLSQINPPNQSDAHKADSSTINNEKSYISLGPIQILGFLFKASNKSQKFDLSSLHRASVEAESSSTASGVADQPSGEGKIDGGRTILSASSSGGPEADNPYEHWDSDSAEREAELRVNGTPQSHHQQLDHIDEPAATATTASITRSYLLLLAGNATIVRLRQKDFAKYLKMNLAARLSLEYNDVQVNTVLVAPPRLVVNVSVLTPDSSSSEGANLMGRLDDGGALNEDAPLHMLADTNATLLELSGEEYHVVRLLPLRSEPLDFDEDLTLSRAAAATTQSATDVELIILTILGAICFVAICTAVLRVVLRRTRASSNKFWFVPSFFQTPLHQPMSVSIGDDHLPHNLAPPTVIYSGSLSHPNWPTHVFQSRHSNISTILDPAPVFAQTKRPFDIDISRHHPSPSKLHIYSCRPGTVVVPLPYHHHTGLDPCVGHDNPNYQN